MAATNDPCIVKVKSQIEALLRIRIVEEEIVKRYGSPGKEQQMRCPVHLSIGQEAAAVGVCSNLLLEDKIFSTHRCHAHYLAKGGSVRKMALELHGKMGGCLDGRGGSMHLMDLDVNVVTSVPIVSSSIPLAVGSALSDMIDGLQSVSVAFFGDASMEEGVYHESANFAALHKLPVVFVCENNMFSVYSHLKQRQPDRDLIDLGAAHGLQTFRADGNDLFDVSSKFEVALRQVRQKKGAVFFLMDTYRSREHCGVNFDDDLGYRDPNETKKWSERDPIQLACEKAILDGLLDQQFIDEQSHKITAMVQSEFDFAEKAPLPTPDMASTYVYA